MNRFCRAHPDRPVAGPRTPWCVECENRARAERRAGRSAATYGQAGKEKERREIEAMRLRIMTAQVERLQDAKRRRGPLQSPAT
jgi:hypothetical protein